MHHNPLIDFLRSYGPNAASDALYDEHVQAEARKHGVEEIKISAPLVDEIGILLTSDNPTNVVLTGTAGDGKTYHIRQVALKHLGTKPEEWPGEDLVLEYSIANGRELRVIRDLSELPESVKAEEIDHITRCLLGTDKQTVYLVAANDGQLLEMWRSASQKQDSPNATQNRVYQLLSNMLREEWEEDERGILKVRMYNLSRRLHPSVVDEAIDHLLEHPRWDEGCQGCNHFDGEKGCPIRTNRSLLRGATTNGDGRVFRNRVRDVIALAAANDQHVPLRQILTLVVNIVLGDSEDQDNPLLTCAKAHKRVLGSEYSKTNPYDNAVGGNLADDTRRRFTIFSTLESYGIGLETTNQFDELLLLRQPASIAEALESVDPVYGEALFEKVRPEYLRGARERLDLKSFGRAMTSQRRRLFFQLPESTETGVDSHWLLTVFHNGGSYLAFRKAVEDGGADNLVTTITRRIIKGFNRAQTGMMTDDTETLWLAGTVGQSDDPTGRVFTIEEIRRTRASGMFHIDVVHNEKRNRPHILVAARFPSPYGEELKPLDVRPLLFEYLLRVADGSLPSSFSRQCHQEIKHFTTMLRQQIARILYDEVPSLERVQMLSLDSEGNIRRDQMRVTVQ